ncbi:beta-1,3-galactosyltransferase 5 isoform X4 [Patella vulgata]|nr:beta-1,3-galactosyltransferase 5 isoform X4 [Patella vulgata]XP_050411986.1 beta-1,3-galactosyltransferase 5 isoform X4 [Patella vulgata]XP_050411988.1 beta-1,3-galactosyltransferase 5 isoform X4 [Patella vulgata]XP_050411990.1 beta-1,3-galactosyltransferase 5 isoform X4 [Patella vulgata]
MGKVLVTRQLIICLGIILVTILFIRQTPSPRPVVIQQLPCEALFENPDDFPYHFTTRKTRVTPLDFNLLTSGHDICEADSIDIVILVVTEHNHVPLRQMIRSTWGAKKTVRRGSKRWNIQTVFLFGLHQDKNMNHDVKLEAAIYGDIVIFDFKDSYYNLTYKVLLGLKWVQDACRQAKYVLKTDDDTYLNLPEILQRLESEEWNTKICGCFSQSEPVERNDIKSKVSMKSYPIKNYPPHVKGRAYFMPRHIATKLVSVAEYIPYVNIEDVHVTGILAKSVGNIEHRGLTEEEYHPYHPAKNCEILSGNILVSSTTAETGLAIWKELQDGNTHKNCDQTNY